ncbi:MAG: MFS transporter, partial [Pseudomonadota bacterium]
MDSDPSLAPGWKDSLSSYRNVLSVVLALTVLLAAMAALSVVIALNLRAAGTSQTVIGLIGSAFAGGLLIGAILAPREIARVGHIRLF